VYDVIEPLSALAERKGTNLAQLALAWTVNQPGVTSAIIGPRTLEQFEDNLGALDVSLSPEDYAEIDAVIAPGTHVAPFYEARFGASQHRW
jgi:aryl-alcohol dehydrogenase-like predicted oxidoreductase